MRLQSSDRFLLAIVGGSILLILVAVVIVLSRAEPTYRSGTEPGDVVFNYLLALQRGDYEQAHSLLSPTLPGYPRDARVMRSQLRSLAVTQEEISYAVIDSWQNGDRATVTVQATTFFRTGLFGSSTSSYTFTVELLQHEGSWKLIANDDWRTWQWCWGQEGGCS